MKKCIRCQMVFHSDVRSRCLYCDSLLFPAESYEQFVAKDEHVALRTGSPLAAAREHERIQYLMGSYFHCRSFAFLYGVSRQEYKKGQSYQRILVEPLNAAFYMKIPWLIVDVIDTILFHLLYRGYCPECNCKFIPVSGSSSNHSDESCQYNKEFFAVLDSIKNGKIVTDENLFQQRAREKRQRGERSAYYDLCSRKSALQAAMDILSIIVSMTLFIYLMAQLSMPIFAKIYQF